jgi:hypothetical protein
VTCFFVPAAEPFFAPQRPIIGTQDRKPQGWLGSGLRLAAPRRAFRAGAGVLAARRLDTVSGQAASLDPVSARASPGKPRFGGIFCVPGLIVKICINGRHCLFDLGAGRGFSGAERSLLWAAILLFFVIRSGNCHLVDARIGKAF